MPEVSASLVSTVSELPSNYEDNYWEAVRLGVEVLGGSSDLVAEARASFSEIPEPEQLLSYNEDPLLRAELITDSDEHTEAQWNEFRSRLRDNGLLPSSPEQTK